MAWAKCNLCFIIRECINIIKSCAGTVLTCYKNKQSIIKILAVRINKNLDFDKFELLLIKYKCNNNI